MQLGDLQTSQLRRIKTSRKPCTLHRFPRFHFHSTPTVSTFLLPVQVPQHGKLARSIMSNALSGTRSTKPWRHTDRDEGRKKTGDSPGHPVARQPVGGVEEHWESGTRNASHPPFHQAEPLELCCSQVVLLAVPLRASVRTRSQGVPEQLLVPPLRCTSLLIQFWFKITS